MGESLRIESSFKYNILREKTTKVQSKFLSGKGGINSSE